MTSAKKFRRETVRRLKSVMTMCFLSLLHLKTPHEGCPGEYNHTTRMSGTFESKRSSRMPGSFDSQRINSVYGSFDPQRMSNVYGGFDSQRASNVYGTFDTPRISRVYGGYESRRASKLICEYPVVEFPTYTATTTLHRMTTHSAPPSSSTQLSTSLPSSPDCP